MFLGLRPSFVRPLDYMTATSLSLTHSLHSLFPSSFYRALRLTFSNRVSKKVHRSYYLQSAQESYLYLYLLISCILSVTGLVIPRLFLTVRTVFFCLQWILLHSSLFKQGFLLLLDIPSFYSYRPYATN